MSGLGFLGPSVATAAAVPLSGHVPGLLGPSVESVPLSSPGLLCCIYSTVGPWPPWPPSPCCSSHVLRHMCHITMNTTATDVPEVLVCKRLTPPKTLSCFMVDARTSNVKERHDHWGESDQRPMTTQFKNIHLWSVKDRSTFVGIAVRRRTKGISL
jgi:hypothetical protein